MDSDMPISKATILIKLEKMSITRSAPCGRSKTFSGLKYKNTQRIKAERK